MANATGTFLYPNRKLIQEFFWGVGGHLAKVIVARRGQDIFDGLMEIASVMRIGAIHLQDRETLCVDTPYENVHFGGR